MWKPIRWKCSCGKHSFPVSVACVAGVEVQSVDQRVGVKQDHRKGEPAQITTYHKIRKISPGLIFFQGPFWRLIFRGAYLRREFTVFALFYSVFESNFQVQASVGAIFGGAIEQKVFCVMSLGGLYLEGLIHVCRGAYFQNFTVYANSPRYGTDLPLSRTGQQISWIKWSFELFCALHVHVVCNN